jgi:hypothetical protein
LKLVKVTKRLIRQGRACDCYFCPVAEALQHATKDEEASVVSRDWQLYLHVWGRYMLAPFEVTAFVHAYDDLNPSGPVDPWDRRLGYMPAVPKILPKELSPFMFEIPDMNDPEWQEECHQCEQLFDAKELDDEGYCLECKD